MNVHPRLPVAIAALVVMLFVAAIAIDRIRNARETAVSSPPVAQLVAPDSLDAPSENTVPEIAGRPDAETGFSVEGVLLRSILTLQNRIEDLTGPSPDEMREQLSTLDLPRFDVSEFPAESTPESLPSDVSQDPPDPVPEPSVAAPQDEDAADHESETTDTQIENDDTVDDTGDGLGESAPTEESDVPAAEEEVEESAQPADAGDEAPPETDAGEDQAAADTLEQGDGAIVIDSTAKTSQELSDSETTSLAALETAVDAAQPSPPSISQQRPTFDTVRVEAQGTVVAAGRAEPGSRVELLLGEDIIASARSLSGGEWALVTQHDMDVGSHLFGLRATGPSGEVVVGDPLVVVLQEPSTDPLLVSVGEESAQVVQTPTPLGEGQVSIDVISYGEDTGARLEGRGPVGETVTVSIKAEDGASGEATLAFETTVDGDGRWSGSLPENIPASARLIVLAETGSGESAQVPFRRSTSEEPPRENTVVVQPGNSLWRIARNEYGKGIMYHLIYDANRELIEMPDLIYPGQEFEIPQADS